MALRVLTCQTDLITYPKNPVALFYHDVPLEPQRWAVAEMTGFAKTSLEARQGNEAWRNINVAFLKCENDRALPLQVQNGMIDRIRQLGIVVEGTSCNSSHTPYLSQPQTVVKWIEGLL